MLVTLNNGKTIEITTEKFFSMSDDQFVQFLDEEYGEEIEDPFFQSQIHKENHKRDYDD